MSQRALELEPAGTGFVTAGEGILAPQTLDEPDNGGTVRRERVQRWCPLARQQDRGDCGGRVLIERDDGSRLRHDRPPLYAALR